MKTEVFSRITTAIAALTLAASGASAGTTPPTPEQAAPKTLANVRHLSEDMSDQASSYGIEIRAAITSTITKRLEVLKADMDNISRDIALLQAEESYLSPWEREAVDRVAPVAKQAVANLNWMIEYHKANPRGLWKTENQKAVRALTDEAERIASVAGDYLKLHQLREREQTVEKQLHPSTPSH